MVGPVNILFVVVVFIVVVLVFQHEFKWYEISFCIMVKQARKNLRFNIHYHMYSTWNIHFYTTCCGKVYVHNLYQPVLSYNYVSSIDAWSDDAELSIFRLQFTSSHTTIDGGHSNIIIFIFILDIFYPIFLIFSKSSSSSLFLDYWVCTVGILVAVVVINFLLILDYLDVYCSSCSRSRRRRHQLSLDSRFSGCVL